MPRQPSGTGIYYVMMRGINHQNIFEGQKSITALIGEIDGNWENHDIPHVKQEPVPVFLTEKV